MNPFYKRKAFFYEKIWKLWFHEISIKYHLDTKNIYLSIKINKYFKHPNIRLVGIKRKYSKVYQFPETIDSK